jgi:hypothetical protein
MAILVKLPWSSQVYALPFLTALCAPQLEGQPFKVFRHHIRRKARSSKKKFVATGKTPRQYKTAVDILMTLTKLLDRWLPDRAKVLVVDGSYAAIKLALVCASLKNTTPDISSRRNIFITCNSARTINRAHSDGASKRSRPLLFIVSRSLASPPTTWQLPLIATAPLGAVT